MGCLTIRVRCYEGAGNDGGRSRRLNGFQQRESILIGRTGMGGRESDKHRGLLYGMIHFRILLGRRAWNQGCRVVHPSTEAPRPFLGPP